MYLLLPFSTDHWQPKNLRGAITLASSSEPLARRNSDPHYRDIRESRYIRISIFRAIHHF